MKVEESQSMKRSSNECHLIKIAESDLCNSRRLREADLPATRSYPDSLEPDMKG
jgi:hypothetical protein